MARFVAGGHTTTAPPELDDIRRITIDTQRKESETTLNY
jgi:hypothetical protein